MGCNNSKTYKKNAIILAAGYGMRMVPIGFNIPKAFLEINGETLIERIIKQLKDAGINEIYVVVGFMKERFNYLTDTYKVNLIENVNYTTKNNLHSLRLASEYINNTYIIPCDIWCKDNPFTGDDASSWYMVSNIVDDNSTVRVNRKMDLKYISHSIGGNEMIGISYLTGQETKIVKERLRKLDAIAKYDDSFWEEALHGQKKMIVPARLIDGRRVVEINTYEQLRELDSSSKQLESDALSVIECTMNVKPDDITDIHVLKKGMTNRSFLFRCKKKQYIMRIPGEGTDMLINRKTEAETYNVINGMDICDKVIYINPGNGYKITEYIENSRVCDPLLVSDLKLCMAKLKQLHNSRVNVEHSFDIFRQIEFYERLWNGEASQYKDYRKTKKNVLSLEGYINEHISVKTLTHIDAVPDNFLLTDNDVRLIDWEYAGMQDPHVDIAMFSIYAGYSKRQIDRLINIYFENKCPLTIRVKIYCYIAVCGLLWSNWCEYKRMLGVNFGEYALKQYRYAKRYYKIAKEKIEEIGEESVVQS